MRIFIAGLFAAASAPAVGAGESPSPVVVIATPDGGIQPQAVVDATGAVHLIWFKGISAGGDLYYARSKAGKPEFSAPIRVNSQPGSAIATGTIRGGQLAPGRDGRVMSPGTARDGASPPNPIKGSPMLYARLNDDGPRLSPSAT